MTTVPERKPGIYLNPKSNEVKRASSPFAVPEGSEWVLMSEDLLTGLVKVREMAKERGLVEDPEKLQWS